MNQPSTLNPDHLNLQIPNNTGLQLVASDAGHASVFANANDVRIRDSNFSITTNVNTAAKPALDTLYQRVAPNAILNDGGRADDAKCHPGTREEVIGLIEKWMDDAESDRILWLSGPAGGGKTAIMKTIIEHAADRGVHTINFFFFRGDSTRNSIQPVVSTLLYQLFHLYPSAVEAVTKIFSTHQRILDGSIAQQLKLISATTPTIRQSSPAGARILLLFDGLDECDVDAERSQGDFLHALEGLLMEDDSPFRLLVASRPEARIKMAFNQLSLDAQTIFLDGQYSPEKDIRRFVTAEFDRIKVSHPSARSLPRDWPLTSDVEGIVTKSSGQFIFAATVMRYIAHASTVPSLSLERVKGIVPNGKNSPFAHLDSVYTFILSQVDDLDATLAMFSLSIAEPNFSLKCLCDYNPRYTHALVESCASELSAIVQLSPEGVLDFYHASLPDFFVDQARSGKYWIDIDVFREKMLIAFWEKPTVLPTGPLALVRKGLQKELISHLKAPSVEITQALLNSPFPDWPKSFLRTKSLQVLFAEIHRLYYSNDEDTYKHILDRAISIFLAREWPPVTGGIPYGQQYLDFYKRRLLDLDEQEMAQWASIVDNRNRAENIDTAFPKSSKAYSIGSPLDPAPPAPTSTAHISPHVLEDKSTHSKSLRQPSAYGSKVSAFPIPRHTQVSSAVCASSTTPSHTSPHPTPDTPTRRKYSEAVVSRSTGTTDANGVTAAAGSSSITVARLMGRKLVNIAPLKAISGAWKRAMPSGRSSLVTSTLTPGDVCGESQRTKEDGDGAKKGNGDKGHTAFTTASPAPRLASKNPIASVNAAPLLGLECAQAGFDKAQS